MYLSQAIRWHGTRYVMIGTVPADVEISGRPQGHGYVELKTVADNSWFARGTMLRGHEFHHSRLLAPDTKACVYKVLRGHGIDGSVDGFCYKNLIASYTHVHALGAPLWAPTFVALAKKYKGKVKLKVKVEKRTRQRKTKDGSGLSRIESF